MGKGEDSAPWREMGRGAVVFSVVVAFYTVAVALASLDQLFGWLNTL